MLRGRLVIGSLKLPFSFRCVRRGFWLLLLMLLFKQSWRSSATSKRTRRWVMEAGMLSSGCENCKQRGPSMRWGECCWKMIKWSVEVFAVNGQTTETRREKVQQAIPGTIDCQISQCCWKIVEAGREDIRSMDSQLCQRGGQ